MGNELRRIHIEPRNIDLAKYKFRRATDLDYHRVLTGEFALVDAAGIPFLGHFILPGNQSLLRTALTGIEFHESFRTNSLLSRSRVIGYQPRMLPRRDYCGAVSLSYDAPAVHEKCLSLAPLIEERYKKLNPELYRRHSEQVARVLPQYRIRGGVFTSGIINDNNPLGYHHDAGNFKNVWSNMVVLKTGVEGGRLVIPELGAAIEFVDGSLLMFDGQSLLHGVTPIRKVQPGAHRFSIVFYSLRGMWSCLPPADEVRRAAMKRTDRERRRAGMKAC